MGSGNERGPGNLKHRLLKEIPWLQGPAPPLGPLGAPYLSIFF